MSVYIGPGRISGGKTVHEFSGKDIDELREYLREAGIKLTRIRKKGGVPLAMITSVEAKILKRLGAKTMTREIAESINRFWTNLAKAKKATEKPKRRQSTKAKKKTPGRRKSEAKKVLEKGEIINRVAMVITILLISKVVNSAIALVWRAFKKWWITYGGF
jgi:hypothetical protein